MPQKGTDIGHLGARDDETIWISKFFDEMRLLRPANVIFWKLVDETQMSNPPEPAMHHYQIKILILLPPRAIYFYSL